MASFLTLALGLVSISSDGSDSSDDTPDDDPVDDPGVDTPDEPFLSYDGRILTGTDSDDVIVIEPSDVNYTDLQVVVGGVGDDHIERDISEIHAGSGDDTLNLDQTYAGLYYGDDGDDLIDIADANATAVFGGDGNDTINRGDAGDIEGNYLSGGAEDDEIDVWSGSNNFSGLRGVPYLMSNSVREPIH